MFGTMKSGLPILAMTLILAVSIYYMYKNITNMNKKMAEMLKEVNNSIERVNDLDQKVKILGLTPRDSGDEEDEEYDNIDSEEVKVETTEEKVEDVSATEVKELIEKSQNESNVVLPDNVNDEDLYNDLERDDSSESSDDSSDSSDDDNLEMKYSNDNLLDNNVGIAIFTNQVEENEVDTRDRIEMIEEDASNNEEQENNSEEEEQENPSNNEEQENDSEEENKIIDSSSSSSEEDNDDESLYESEGNGDETDGEQINNLQNYMDNIKLDIKKNEDDESSSLENDKVEEKPETTEDKNIIVKTGKKRRGPPSTFGELASTYETGHIIVDDDYVEWVVTESRNKIKRWKKKI